MIVLDGVEMVDVQEAARIARRTRETVRRWVWSGRLDATKRGNRLLVPREDVLALAGARSGEPARPRLTLGQWSSEVLADRAGASGASAADLVQDDRARR